MCCWVASKFVFRWTPKQILQRLIPCSFQLFPPDQLLRAPLIVETQRALAFGVEEIWIILNLSTISRRSRLRSSDPTPQCHAVRWFMISRERERQRERCRLLSFTMPPMPSQQVPSIQKPHHHHSCKPRPSAAQCLCHPSCFWPVQGACIHLRIHQIWSSHHYPLRSSLSDLWGDGPPRSCICTHLVMHHWSAWFPE